MGTDIHMILQKKIRKTSPDYQAWETLRRIDLRRDYDFFGLLANVRNGTGFAGAKTGEPISPITKDRGFPEDFEDNIYFKYNSESAYIHVPNFDQHQYGNPDSLMFMGYQDFGWCYLKEIADYNHINRQHCGYVDRAWAENASPGNPPDDYCADIVGSNVVKGSLSDPAANHIFWEWSTSTRDCIPPAIQALLKEFHNDLTGHRLIFGFDS